VTFTLVWGSAAVKRLKNIVLHPQIYTGLWLHPLMLYKHKVLRNVNKLIIAH